MSNNSDISNHNASSSKLTAQSIKKLPSRVLYVLVGIIALVFILFWLVGFDRPYVDDPNFNEPLLTDVLMVLMILMTIGGIALVAWSIVRDMKVVGKGESYSNNIPVKKIGYCVACGTFVVMLLTFILGSSTPMKINGADYTDAFWLKVSDMFVCSSILLIVAAIAAVIYGSTKYIRKP